MDTCPNCGFCKHCGRGGHQVYPLYPSYPWNVGPYWYYHQPYTTGGITTSGNANIVTSGASAVGSGALGQNISFTN